MERLRTLAILVSLAAAGRAAAGADDGQSPPAEAQAPANPAAPAPAARPEPPVPPKKYLETGAILFNRKQYDLAAKYLEAAQRYRDRLTLNEQVVLDEFRDQLDRYAQDQKRAREAVAAGPAAGPAADPAVAPASTVGPAPLDMSGKRPEPPPVEAAPGTEPDALSWRALATRAGGEAISADSY